MLAVAATVMLFAAFVAFAFGVVSPSVALLGSEGMRATGRGVVREVVPHVVPDGNGEMRVWLGYEVDLELDGGTEGVSVWAPDWYGARETGTELALAYDADNPGACMIADVRDVMARLIRPSARASILLASVGVALAAMSVMTGA